MMMIVMEIKMSLTRSESKPNYQGWIKLCCHKIIRLDLDSYVSPNFVSLGILPFKPHSFSFSAGLGIAFEAL